MNEIKSSSPCEFDVLSYVFLIVVVVEATMVVDEETTTEMVVLVLIEITMEETVHDRTKLLWQPFMY